MKYNFDGVIVVEGKDDVSYLSSFLNGLFFTTNGLDISDKKIEFLKLISKVNKLIIMTDNDASGEVIRNRIVNQINGCFVVKISGKSRKNYKKNGVAEANRDEILNLIQNHLVDHDIQLVKYDLNKYVSLSKQGHELKMKLIEKYRLIDGNIKYIENQLNMLKISKSEIKLLLEKLI